MLDGTVYPLAFLASRGAGMNAVSGLGVGGMWAVDFWPPVAPCASPTDPTERCAPTIDRYATNEYLYELGLRWKWNFLRKADNVPELLVRLEYGQHSFAIQRRNYINEGGERDVGPPNVLYSYVTIGAGLRVPFLTRFAANLLFNYHAVLDTGPIANADTEWGATGAWGVRIAGGLDVRIWRGLFGRVTGHYEQFGLSFTPPPPNATPHTMPPCGTTGGLQPCRTSGGATDQYYGVTFSAGYIY
jgi:hypothetical protein